MNKLLLLPNTGQSNAKRRKMKTNHSVLICRLDSVASLTWWGAAPLPTAGLASCTAQPWCGWLSPVDRSSRMVAHQQASCTGQNPVRKYQSLVHVLSRRQPHCKKTSATYHLPSCYPYYYQPPSVTPWHSVALLAPSRIDHSAVLAARCEFPVSTSFAPH